MVTSETATPSSSYSGLRQVASEGLDDGCFLYYVFVE